MKILFAGGGTGGPVAPMLAVAQQIKKINPDAEFLFVGTKSGPEKQLVETHGFKFTNIPSAKWRRYFSIMNFIDIFKFIGAFAKSFLILGKFKPNLIFSVGGFVAVPIALAGRVKGIKLIIHQQDIRPGLANKMISPFASVITTAFEENVKKFYTGSGLADLAKSKRRIEWVGNPVREEFLNNDLPHKDFFRLKGELPLLLIFGGATGAIQINGVVQKALPRLSEMFEIVHITGKGKHIQFANPNYHSYQFISEQWPTIMKMANIVVGRAGLSSLAELSELGKVSVIVPMPNSHQEDNAEVLKNNRAAIVMAKDQFTPENLVEVLSKIKFDSNLQKSLSENMSKMMPRDSAKRLAQIILEHAN